MSRKLVEGVFGPDMTAKIWTGNYSAVYPFVLNAFDISALLPAALYLFRWGHRRGKGRFIETFSDPSAGRPAKPTIARVSEQLAGSEFFDGFDDETSRAILGDLLLTYVFENKGYAEGRNNQIQRVLPAHYMASWIDLPDKFAHLRGVPEMLVALVADQADGEALEPAKSKGRFPIRCRIEENDLLRALAPGMTVAGDYVTDLRSDRFDEATKVGLDQLLTIRIAQQCGSAPLKASGKGNPGPIPNQRPIATVAGRQFRDDLVVFLRAYAATMPRLSLLPMLESALALNLTNVFLSTANILFQWLERNRLPDESEQRPWPLFVDCSLALDRDLQRLSERSMESCRMRLAGVPRVLMYLRLLDWQVRYDSDIAREELPADAPDARAWLDLLGSIAAGTHEESRHSMRLFRRYRRRLADALEKEEQGHPLVDTLRAEPPARDEAWSLAEAVTALGDSLEATQNLFQFLNGCLMIDRPSGIARRRRVRAVGVASARRTVDMYSAILSNTALEFLVHRHLRRNGKGLKPAVLSLPQFIELLRHGYGLHVDRAPPDLPVPDDLLQRNRRFLERRLRDLGLLVGVNDAESMKRLRQRFPAATDEAG